MVLFRAYSQQSQSHFITEMWKFIEKSKWIYKEDFPSFFLTRMLISSTVNLQSQSPSQRQVLGWNAGFSWVDRIHILASVSNWKCTKKCIQDIPVTIFREQTILLSVKMTRIETAEQLKQTICQRSRFEWDSQNKPPSTRIGWLSLFRGFPA